MSNTTGMIDIGSRVRARRKELEMSQEELALKVGYKSRSSINKIELGERDIPQKLIRKICVALDTTPGYLFGDDETEPAAERSELVNEIYSIFSDLSPEKQSELLRYAHYLASAEDTP